MRVFVTGASGYIGSAVALAFRRRGHQVFGLVRSSEHANKLMKNEISPVLGEIGNSQTYSLYAEQAEILIHCALDNSATFVEKDSLLINTFLKAAQKSNQHKTIIYTSGVWVYGNTQGDIIDETAPLNPLSLVRWRPRHEERIVQAASSHLSPVVIRPGCVYGAQGNLTALWFAEAAASNKISIIEEGKQHWAMIHRDDLAESYVLASEKGLSGTLINVTDGTHHTVREMVESAAEAAGIKGKVVSISREEAVRRWGPLADGLTVDQHISNKRAMKLLNWQARHKSFIEEIDLYWHAWKTGQDKIS
jgi:nucleoside-diphosphate-sugar epimerase